jgi:hypothetical protein
MPSLVYQGEELTDCELAMITISTYIPVEPADPNRSSGKWQVELEGKVYYRVYTPSLGSLQLNLTSTWSIFKQEIRGGILYLNNRLFLGRDDTYLSLSWAEKVFSLSSLKLWAHFAGREMALGLQDVNYTGVSMTFVRNPRTTTTDIKSRQFFDTRVKARNNSHHNDVQPWESLETGGGSGRFLVEDAVAMNLTPSIWAQADDLSKVFLSTMWTDLGQVSTTPNIFSDPELLQHFSSQHGSEGTQPVMDIALPSDTYEASPENNARLGVRPSVLSTNYLCQVPRRKPWGSLIIAILVADLVLLRALWTVVTFVSTHFAKRRDPLANTCETCARSLREKVESSDEQSYPAGGSALELEHLNSGSSLPVRSRSSSLNESLGSRRH